MAKLKICQQVRENLRYLMSINLDALASEDEMQELGKRLPYPMNYSCGCTQGCFVSPEYATVIKWEIDPDEEACWSSLRRYEIAEEMGVADILLPLKYVGDSKNGTALFVQTKFSFAHCDLSGHQRSQFKKNNIQIKDRLVAKIDYDCYKSRLPWDWTSSALRVYGKRFMRKFEEFTCVCKVNDLHSANVGYLHNKPIIIDYAGYCTGWQFDEES